MKTVQALEAEIAEITALIDDFEAPPNLPEPLGSIPLVGLRRRLRELEETLSDSHD